MRYGFDQIEEKAKSYVDVKEYKAATQHTKRCKRFFDESCTPDTELSPRDQFRVYVFDRITDCLTVELRKRVNAYILLCTNCLVF